MTGPQDIPIPIQLPEGDLFEIQISGTYQTLVVPGGTQQARVVLTLPDGKTLWIPIDEQSLKQFRDELNMFQFSEPDEPS